MKRALTILFWVLLSAFPFSAWGQEENELPWYLRHTHREAFEKDNPRFTTSLGMPLTAPLGQTADHASYGLGTNFSAGYNFNRRHALVGEFMWNWLYPTDQTLRPIQVALNTNKVSGHGNLFAFTGAYKFELRGRSLGTYVIVGGGWYYRTASLSRSLPAGTMIECTPVFLWWGFDCSSGAVVGDLTEIHSNASSAGVNGGVGFTFRVGEAPYRMYVETRYHYAPTKDIKTELITVNWGIRY
jgi:Outer membrane protein beta-barrel domain